MGGPGLLAVLYNEDCRLSIGSKHLSKFVGDCGYLRLSVGGLYKKHGVSCYAKDQVRFG